MKYLLIILLTVFMLSCQKKETENTYYPCVPAQFSVKGNFTIDLPDLKPTNVKEVRFDIRTPVSDTFKITILGRDQCLYLKMGYDEAIQTNLMTWIVKGDDCLNTIHGNVNQPIEGYINIVYY